MAQVTISRTKLVNPPRRKRPSAAPQKRKAKNPAQLFTLGFLNPPRSNRMKKKTNARPKQKHRKNPPRRMTKKANPAPRRVKRRNPGIAGKATGFFRMGLMAVLGALVTRQAPQMLLGSRNAGIMGYAANVAAAMAAAALATRVTNRQDAMSVAVGGAVYTVNRIISEKTSGPIRALALSGVGDVQAFTPRRGMRGIAPGYFASPAAYDSAGRPVIPTEIIDAVRSNLQTQPIAPPPAASMAGARFRRAA